MLPTIAPYLLPEVMAEFMEKFPGVETVVQEDTTAQLLKLAHGYEIDFALASQPIRDERLEVKELFSEELLLALPPGHPLTRKRTVAVADLKGERLIVMKGGHCLGDQVLGFCDRRDVKPKISFRSAQLETVQALVVAGLGISLIPAMAARSERGICRSIARSSHRSRSEKSSLPGRSNARPVVPPMSSSSWFPRDSAGPALIFSTHYNPARWQMQ